MITEISINTNNITEAVKIKSALEKIAAKTTISNLEFLAELADIPGINDKLSNPINRIAMKAKLKQ